MNPAAAQLSIGIQVPGISIGINVPVYPQLVRVPDYPVYYAPGLNANFFFYDGMYWVYQNDGWYASSWYNGPWGMVEPEVVPLFVLRIPVRYYRNPPMYFRGWRADAPPRWGDHWGHDWEQRHGGWDRWNRGSAPAPAPLPAYQRQYSGDRYPQAERQPEIHGQNYRYQPRDAVVRQHYEEQHIAPRAPAPAQRAPQPAPQERRPRQQDNSPRAMPPRGAEGPPQRAAPNQPAPQQQPGAGREEPPRQQQDPKRGRGQGNDKERDKGDRGDKSDERSPERGGRQ